MDQELGYWGSVGMGPHPRRDSAIGVSPPDPALPTTNFTSAST